MPKLQPNLDAALQGVLRDGMSIMLGGFGLCGVPEHLVRAVRASGVRDLTLISNNMGTEDWGPGLLFLEGQVRKIVCSFLGGHKPLEEAVAAGQIELQLIPQGNFVEAMRAAGAGIPAFWTPTGVGTMIAAGREVRSLEGQEYMLEPALHADLALIKAWQGDEQGNLRYRKTARNTNPVMAAAATLTIAELEELVPAGSIPPDMVHTPGIYVDRLVVGTDFEKVIEFRTTRPRAAD